MFDGFKIECRETKAQQWINNPLLDFPLLINERTGSIMNRTRISKYKSIELRIVPSETNPNETKCFINGSIHKYWNGNGSNANDFRLPEVQSTIEDICNKFDININEKFLRIEFGVNIELPITAKEFLKRIISMPRKQFAEMNVTQPGLGKVCSYNDHEIKIYDKGRQEKTKVNNLLRFEVRVKKMRFLRPYNIESLKDLCDIDKVTKLGKPLHDMFMDIIYYEAPKDFDLLPEKKKIILLTLNNPINWVIVNRKKRYKQKLIYESLLQELGANKLKNDIGCKIIEKWNGLINMQQKTPGHLHHSDNEKKQHQKGTLHPKIRGANVPFLIGGFVKLAGVI